MYFHDYSELVLKEFHRLKSLNQLPGNLLRPSPARIKKECIAVCTKRYSRKDEVLLEGFFGMGASREEAIRAIKNCDRDKFKPLINFINRRTAKPDEKIPELLAWLIDFQPRPFDSSNRFPLPAEKEAIEQPTIPLAPTEPVVDKDRAIDNNFLPTPSRTQIEGQRSPETKPGNSVNKKRLLLLAILLLMLLTGATYWTFKKNKTGNFQQCMYWSVDHYEPIDCNTKKDNTVVLGLNSLKLTKFRRVMRPDTISYAAIGYLWYCKITVDSVEYYTADGVHPLDFRKKLKPITAYIIDKYILAKPNP